MLTGTFELCYNRQMLAAAALHWLWVMLWQTNAHRCIAVSYAMTENAHRCIALSYAITDKCSQVHCIESCYDGQMLTGALHWVMIWQTNAHGCFWVLLTDECSQVHCIELFCDRQMLTAALHWQWVMLWQTNAHKCIALIDAMTDNCSQKFALTCTHYKNVICISNFVFAL